VTRCDATTWPDRTTTELMCAARRGDSGAWDSLVRRFADVVDGTVRRYRLQEADARDAAQRTWLRLLEHHDQLHNPEALGGWLSTTAARECLRILRGRTWAELVVEAVDPVDPAGGPERRVLDAAAAGELRTLIESLPERSRVLMAALFDEAPPRYAELSRRTGIPIGSIGPTRARALRQLKALLGERSPEVLRQPRPVG
jgi:RNA polymerase sigma factor (sigma-70 family)